MEKIFGSEALGFSIRCKKTIEKSAGVFVNLNLRFKNLEVGSFENTCHAGAIIHSAQIFLKNKNNRSHFTLNDSEIFNFLFQNLYGEKWQVGLHKKFGPRFALHEVFDVSVGDEGWIVFLVDKENEATLTIGSRDGGFISSIKTPIGFVESSIQDLVDWLSHPG